jgi:hypothetical protein
MARGDEMQKRSYRPIVSLIIGLLTALQCTPLHRAAAQERAASRHTQKRIETLIEMLASKNEAPTPKRNHLDVPQGYERQAQAVVYLAIQQLLAEGSEAFDLLIQHLEDARYSHSYESIQGDFNRNVGAVCDDILVRSVECYEFEIDLISWDQQEIFLNGKSKAELAKWWKENRERPLWKLQLEAIDRQIEFQKTADRDRVRSIHPEAPRLPAEEFEKLREKNLELLKRRRASIEAAEEAYRPKSLEHYFGTMTLLPWGKGRTGFNL